MGKKRKRSSGKEKVRTATPKNGFATKMLSHFIPYEVGMMRAVSKRLAAGSVSRVQRNAEIESFHIHARNLIEFFTDDKQCAIDPRTFTTPNYRVKGNFIPAKLKSKISQQIVHLTHERTDVEKDKLSDDERMQTLRYIEEEIARFEKALDPHWLPIWEGGLRMMRFDGPTGPDNVFRYVSGPTGPSAPPQLKADDSVRGPTNHVESTASSADQQVAPRGAVGPNIEGSKS
jgi:hypothetical protein